MNKTTITTEEIPAIMSVAIEVAREAGDYLLSQLGHAKIEHQKSLRDDLLDVDLESEHIILTKLREKTPYIGILSEEAGYEGRRDQYWVIDPLDGSANYQRGIPIFGIAIALIVNEQPLSSLIYLPIGRELYTATQGQGAYINNSPISVSGTASLPDAIILFGDFMKEDDPITTQRGLEDFAKLSTQARRIRMIGTAATDLAYVASGKTDALINHTTNLWDIQAGQLLVQEAGGMITTIKRPNSKPLSIYSNANIHHMVKNILTTLPYTNTDL